jgi:hypothetical protein
MSKQEAEKTFPDVEQRVLRTGYLSNPQKAEQLRKRRETARVTRDSGLMDIAGQLGLTTLKSVKKTPQGVDFMARHSGWGDKDDKVELSDTPDDEL